jgi:hypothetical protein
MRPRNCVLFPICLALLLATCTSNPDGAEYFWASSGSRKTYDVKMLVPLVGTLEGTIIEREDGTVNINGKTYHRFITSYDGIPGTETEVGYRRLAPDGIYSRKSTEENAPESLEIPLPPKIGRTWSYSREDLRMEKEIATLEDLDTAEKTYKRCLKITGKGRQGFRSVKTVSYYAPKIGLVKMSMELSGVLMELKIQNE